MKVQQYLSEILWTDYSLNFKFYCKFAARTPKRKAAGVVDRAALEMRCTGNCTGGSNPSLSANKNTLQIPDLQGVFVFFVVFKCS